MTGKFCLNSLVKEGHPVVGSCGRIYFLKEPRVLFLFCSHFHLMLLVLCESLCLLMLNELEGVIFRWQLSGP